MFNLRKRLNAIRLEDISWEDICFRVPIIRQPKCFDQGNVNIFDLLKLKKKRSININGQENQCEMETLPKLNLVQKVAFLPLAKKIMNKGFTSDIGEI